MKRFVFFILIVSSFALKVKCECCEEGNTDCCLNSKDKCCPCFPNAAVQASFNNRYFQYTGPHVSKQEMCKMAVKDGKIFQDYIDKCKYKGMKNAAIMFQNMLTKSWTDFCSPNWPEEPKCKKEPEAVKAVKSCFQRLTNVGYYILKNIPQKDELSVHCCTLPMQLDCAFNAAKQYCGKKYAKLLTKRIFGEFFKQQANGVYCANLGNACEKYEADLEVIKKILEESEVTERSMAYTFYKIILNDIQAQCLNYD